jgi:hypothetical protein
LLDSSLLKRYLSISFHISLVIIIIIITIALHIVLTLIKEVLKKFKKRKPSENPLVYFSLVGTLVNVVRRSVEWIFHMKDWRF